jgi:hypothetical protein
MKQEFVISTPIAFTAEYGITTDINLSSYTSCVSDAINNNIQYNFTIKFPELTNSVGVIYDRNLNAISSSSVLNDSLFKYKVDWTNGIATISQFASVIDCGNFINKYTIRIDISNRNEYFDIERQTYYGKNTFFNITNLLSTSDFVFQKCGNLVPVVLPVVGSGAIKISSIDPLDPTDSSQYINITSTSNVIPSSYTKIYLEGNSTENPTYLYIQLYRDCQGANQYFNVTFNYTAYIDTQTLPEYYVYYDMTTNLGGLATYPIKYDCDDTKIYKQVYVIDSINNTNISVDKVAGDGLAVYTDKNATIPLTQQIKSFPYVINDGNTFNDLAFNCPSYSYILNNYVDATQAYMNVRSTCPTLIIDYVVPFVFKQFVDIQNKTINIDYGKFEGIET